MHDITVVLNGLTVDQAVTKIKGSLPREVADDIPVEVIRHLKEIAVNGIIEDRVLQLKLGTFNDMVQDIMPEGMDIDFDRKYNGVLGDSCECPVCNERRARFGPDILADKEKGINAFESSQTVLKNNLTSMLDKAGEKVTKVMDKTSTFEDKLINALFGPKLDTKKRIQENADGARKAYVKTFGEGSQQVKDMDRMTELGLLESRTEAQQNELAALLREGLELYPQVQAVMLGRRATTH